MSDVLRILNQHKFTVLFSGGKDSTAALLWVYNNVSHNNWNVLYVEVTENTHPLCSQYVNEVCDSLGLHERLLTVKTADFFELMDRWGPPLLFAYRWCLYQLKIKAFNKHAYYYTVDGIRRENSKIRKGLKAINVLKIAKRIAISPLTTWTTQQVIDYIKDNGFKLNPCYARFGHSGNCMFCPYANKRHITLTLADPYWREKIVSALKKHENKMKKGSIGRSVFNRWMKNTPQLSLAKFVEEIPN